MKREEQEAAICRGAYRLMTDPDFEQFRLWWEAEALRSALPPGQVDPYRLAMAQGDRERLLAVMAKAGAHRARMKEG